MLREVTLRGNHVVLEPLREGHVDALWPAADEPAMWRFMSAPVDDAEDLRDWIRARSAAVEAGTALAFLQRDVHSGEAVGTTSLFDVDLGHQRGEIGHTWIGRAHRRTAVNTEAKLLLLTHAFEALGLHRVQLKTDARNVNSVAAITRLGAVREGTLRRHMVCWDGSARDTVMFSIVREDWPDVKGRLDALLTKAA